MFVKVFPIALTAAIASKEVAPKLPHTLMKAIVNASETCLVILH